MDAIINAINEIISLEDIAKIELALKDRKTLLKEVKKESDKTQKAISDEQADMQGRDVISTKRINDLVEVKVGAETCFIKLKAVNPNTVSGIVLDGEGNPVINTTGKLAGKPKTMWRYFKWVIA